MPVYDAKSEWMTEELKSLVVATAQNRGLKVQKFLATAECEVKKRPDNSWDYKAQSDHISGNKRENSWGLWQINLDWNPDVTKEQAQDPIWSTEWAAHEWTNGNAFLWSCYNILYGK